jgi:hypothetical protein
MAGQATQQTSKFVTQRHGRVPFSAMCLCASVAALSFQGAGRIDTIASPVTVDFVPIDSFRGRGGIATAETDGLGVGGYVSFRQPHVLLITRALGGP